MVNDGFERVIKECRHSHFDAVKLIRNIQLFLSDDGEKVDEMRQHIENGVVERVADDRKTAEGARHELCDLWDQDKLDNSTLIWAILVAEAYDQPFAKLIARGISSVFQEAPDEEIAERERRKMRQYIEKYSATSEIMRNLRDALETGVNTFLAVDTRKQDSLPHIGGEWPFDIDFFEREECETKLRNNIAALCKGPPGALIVDGEPGIGKTSLITHILRDSDFITKECSAVRALVWLNVCELTMATPPFNEPAFYSSLVSLFRSVGVVDDSTQPSLADMQRSFSNTPPNVLVVFDDVFCPDVLRTMALISCKTRGLIRSIVITRNYNRVRIFEYFKCQRLQVEPMPPMSVQKMLGDHYKLRQGHGLEEGQIERLANMCRGLPLIASVINSHFRKLVFKDEVQQTFTHLASTIGAIVGATFTPGRSCQMSQITVTKLLQHSPEFASEAFQGLYYTFLVFEPGDAVDIRDLVVLWKCTITDVVRLCEKAVKGGLLRPAGLGDMNHNPVTSYMFHALFYNAAIEQSRKDYGNVSLQELRKKILVKYWSIPGRNSLLLAIHNERKKLLQVFQKFGDTKTLAEMAIGWDVEEDTTVLHQLVNVTLHQSEKWLLNEGLPTESCLSSELVCRFADTLANNDLTRTSQSFCSKRDTQSGLSIFDLIAATMNDVEANAKWYRNIFLVAAKYGCIKLVKLLLAEKGTKRFGARGDCDGNNALIMALDNGHLEIVKLLIESGLIDVNAQNQRGETALMKCVKFVKCVDFAKTLCVASRPKAVDVNVVDINGDSALIYATSYGKTEFARYLVNEQKADIGIVTRINKTNALEVAIALNWYPEIGRFLIEKGAGMAEGWYQQALQNAKKRREQEFLAFLTDKRRDLLHNKGRNTQLLRIISVQERREKSALHEAAKNGELEQIVKIITAGSDLDKKDEFGQTALMFACDKGQFEVARLLIDRGASVNAQDQEGWTGLMFASQNGNVEVAKLLIHRGAYLNVQSHTGATALMAASVKGHFEIVKVLASRGAFVDAQNFEGWTALMFASDRGHFEVAKVLVHHGANIGLTTSFGDTAIMFARRNNHLRIAYLLSPSHFIILAVLAIVFVILCSLAIAAFWIYKHYTKYAHNN